MPGNNTVRNNRSSASKGKAEDTVTPRITRSSANKGKAEDTVTPRITRSSTGKAPVTPSPFQTAKKRSHQESVEESDEDDLPIAPRILKSRGASKGKAAVLPTPKTGKAAPRRRAQPGKTEIDKAPSTSVVEEEKKERGEEGDEIFDLIYVAENDDPYPSEEGESDEEDEENAASESPAREAESSHRQKKARTMTGEEWIEMLNLEHPVSENDPCVQRFQENFGAICDRLCAWSTTGDITGWFKLPQPEREMSLSFRSFLMRFQAGELSASIFDHMPRKAQQVLGKADLEPVDLVNLPVVPKNFPHRLTYFDIPAQVGQANITQANIGREVPVKCLKPGSAITSSMAAKVYTGMSIHKGGGGKRHAQHELQINRPEDIRDRNLHYDFAAQEDVIPNFVMAGIWSNPFVPDTELRQDIERAFPQVLEGLLMVFLGTYHRMYQAQSKKSKIFFSDSSYVLVDSLREGLPLPDLHMNSLNRVWPLMQRVPGGLVKVNKCANPDCTEVPGRTQFHTLWNTHGYRYCRPCYISFRVHGRLRTREGRANGLWQSESPGAVASTVGKINDEWLAAGNPRQCSNTVCGVQIHENATLYGYQRGIRCHRCHTHCVRYKKEWTPKDQAGHKFSDCQVCGEEKATHLNGKKELCDGCYSIQCCFGRDKVPDGAANKTFATCANAGCSTGSIFTEGGRLIQDITTMTWRCLPCDWIYSIWGVEIPEGLAKNIEDAPPPCKIEHHQYNATACFECGRYVTCAPWKKMFAPGSGYLCGLCSGDRCSNPSCQTHVSMVACTLLRDRDLNDVFCGPCSKYNKTQKHAGLEKLRDFVIGFRMAKRREDLKIPRTCLNCNKVETAEIIAKGSARHKKAKDHPDLKYRCKTCHDSYMAHTRRDRVVMRTKSQRSGVTRPTEEAVKAS